MTTVTEEVADVVEAVADEALETLVVMRQNRALLVGVGVVGVIAGFAGGYILAKKQLETRYANLAQEEVEEAKNFFENLAAARTEKPASPSDLLKDRVPVPEAAMTALRDYRGEALIRDAETPADTEEELVIEEVVVEHNVFIGDSDEFDYEIEYAKRTEFPDEPYIISKQEHVENVPEFEQVTMTYFEGDDTLLDETEQPVVNTDGVVGDDNMIKFGHGSEDKNIVYIRNEALETDYEVVRHTGSYVEYLGFEHSDDTRRRRFREHDE